MRPALHARLRCFKRKLVLSPYLGQVSTRSYLPTALSGTNNSLMSRTAHIATQAMTTAPQIGFPGFYTSGAGVDTATSAASLTYTASIEYPAGTFTQVTWGAATSKTTTSVIPFSNGALSWTGLSDTGITLATSIPLGAQYWVRNFQVTPGATGGGIVSTAPTSPTRWAAAGEASVISSGAGTDLTMSGTVTDGGSGALVYPCCIVATTSNPTMGLLGDSRTIGSTSSGTGSSVDSNGNMGQAARSLGTAYGYINAGIGGTQMSQFNTNGEARAYFLNTFCSHIINGFGINDIRTAGGNRSAAQLQADYILAARRFPTKTLIASTISPATSGTFTTTAGQTADGNAAARQTVNAWIKSLPFPYRMVVDIASVTQDATLTDVWPANATSDGLHAIGATYDTVVSSGVLNAAAIATTSPRVQFSALALGVAKTPIWIDFANPAICPTTPPSVQSCAGSRYVFNMSGLTYGATSFNGGPGYVFNGTSGSLLGDATYAKPFSSGVAGITLAGLVSLTTLPASTRAWFGFTINGSNSERALLTMDSAGKPGLAFRRLDADTTVTAVSATSVGTATPFLFAAVFDPTGGTATLYINGVSVASGSFGSTGSFSATSSNNVTVCTLAALFTAIVGRELWMFDSALSTTNRQKVEGDIAWRSGLAATLLPGAHPYLNAAP